MTERFGEPTITDWFAARGIDDPAVVAPVCAAFAAEKAEPIPSLQEMLRLLYLAEVDWNIASAWDAGFRLAVHAPRGDDWTSRHFTVGRGAHDHPTWEACWEAAVLFICETVVSDWDNLEDGAPVDIGCLDCTMNTTPVDLTTETCVYHVARSVLKAHGLKSARSAPGNSEAEGG